MIRYLTAGESHGKGLTAVIEGIPSNLEISAEYINTQLARRQTGYGRGMRMKIEKDTAEILAGIRYGKTLGSPISLFIENRDWKNWTEIMSPEDREEHEDPITIPRPGHADMVGVTKYDFDDIRNSIDRSSARETAARVAAGTVARKYLEVFGIRIGSFVESIGGIYPADNLYEKLLLNETDLTDAWELSENADKSEVRVLEEKQESEIIDKIKLAKKRGDTLGGTMIAVATGMPPGLGSFVHYDRKLDSAIARDMMSINAIKGVELGKGFDYADAFGSEAHDELAIEDGRIVRRRNSGGGIEGGVSNGMPVIVRAAMKPIATLMSPIGTIDLKGMKEVEARRERSDFVAVPACAVIMESVLAWTLAEFMTEKFGGDSIRETKENYDNYMNGITERIKNRFM